MRRTIYNDDSQGVMETRPGQAVADLQAWVDKPLERLNIDTYAWCIAFPDVCMHHTQVGEVYGARFETPPDAAAAAIAQLHAQGTDVLHVVAERARQHQVEFVASVRMNDTHGLFLDASNPQIAQFLLDHPQWIIRRDDGVPERALDYSVPQVREHRLGILRELAQNYDIDGLELDFTRWAKFFRRSEAPFKAALMSQFVGQVRQMLDEVAQARQRPRFVLGVQVIESLYYNLMAGLEPKRWVEAGWIDYLIQSDFNCTNPQLPVAEFAEFCRPSPCTHHVRMGNMMAAGGSGKPHVRGRATAAYKGNPSYGGMVLTPDEARGAAANIYGFGADGIGLWNICCNLGQQHKADATGVDRGKFQQDMMAWIEAVDGPDKVWSARRTYHFVPIYKKAALPVRNYPVNSLLSGPTGWPTQILHFDAKARGHRQVYRFLCAEGQRRTAPLKGEMRWRLLACLPEDKFRFDLNGSPLEEERQVEADDELPALWFSVRFDEDLLVAGTNELGVTLVHLAQGPRPEAPPYMEELVLKVEAME